MSINFQVAAVSKPLFAVKRIVERGNHVSFGPGNKDNFIFNEGAGERMLLTPNGRGSYLMKV
eukprot:8929858-Karenia_brevis.AAC.1